MSKRKTDYPEYAEAERPSAAIATIPFPAEEIGRIEISAPLAEMPEGAYAQRHIDAQLNRQQALALRRLVLGLDLTDARLANYRRVISGADAIRWLLERMNGRG